MNPPDTDLSHTTPANPLLQPSNPDQDLVRMHASSPSAAASSSPSWQSDDDRFSLLDIQNRQPTINIGAIGHVAHGKSTLVYKLTGVKTAQHSADIGSNMTIRLGYANAKIYKCDECPKPRCYKAYGSSQKGNPKCPEEGCTARMSLVRHLSFVDCPGHEVLMATMLNATAIMDAAMLVISAKEPCPRPQTAEHLAAADLIGLKHFVTVQNKLDLVDLASARQHADDVRKFVAGTSAENSPLVPMAAVYGVNVDVLCQYLVEKIPHPVRAFDRPARMQAIRSFDVNKPGTPFEELKGAVLGGSLEQGTLRVGQTIEIRPGVVRRNEQGKLICQPLVSQVMSLSSEKTRLDFAVPGGLIGVGTNIDPSLAKSDGMVGQVLGAAGTLPDVYQDLTLEYKMLRRLVGSASAAKVQRLKAGEAVMLHVGSSTTTATVTAVDPTQHTLQLHLALPVCADKGQKVAFSRNVDRQWRLVGWGTLCGESAPLTLASSVA